MSKLKIALLAGGVSGEREVSLNTGQKIFEGLDKKKYEVSRYDPKDDLERFFSDALAKKFDLVLPALHGPYGEDGKLQGMLDMINMPYVFSGCLASALAMDKKKTKIVVKDAGINVARDIILFKGEPYDLDEIIKDLSFPVVVKPVELGSSVGASIAQSREELEAGIIEAFKHDYRIMCEKFIKGRELTVGVMGNELKAEALPVIEIIPKVSSWFDYRAKYEPGASEEICPAKIPDKMRDKAQELSIKVFQAVGNKDVARADFIWCESSNKLYFLEINTIPGMTATSLVPQAAKAAGMEFPKFLDKLIVSALDNIKKVD